MTTKQHRRLLFRLGNGNNKGGVECFLWENKLKQNSMLFLLRARTSAASKWSTLSAPVPMAFGRWHFIVVRHVQPFLRKSGVQVFVDGEEIAKATLTFPSLASMDDNILGAGLCGRMSEPTLYEADVDADFSVSESLNER